MKQFKKNKKRQKKADPYQWFMFCLRCSHVVIDENVNGLCGNCGYQFRLSHPE